MHPYSENPNLKPKEFTIFKTYSIDSLPNICIDLIVKRDILYVDDELDNLVAFKAIFRRYFNVETALSGTAAIEVLKSHAVDLVLTDQRMPNMSGVELCQYVRQHYPTIPCMIVTGYPDQAVMNNAIREGQVGKFITKPWDPADLKSEIEAIMA